jgi:hypothetical protein
MVGWNYPYSNNLHHIIEKFDLIPVTVLTSLNQSEKKMFLANDVVLSKQLDNIELLKSYGFNDIKIKAILKEVGEIDEIKDM